MIKKECQKIGIDVDNYNSWNNNNKELRRKVKKIMIDINVKLQKKHNRGLRLFTKHFFYFDLIKL